MARLARLTRARPRAGVGVQGGAVKEISSAFANRWLMARASMALVLASARYWTRVAPLVRAQLRHWEPRARAIEDLELRALALDKLRDEGFTAEAAAMLATFAPKTHRRCAVEAIVALEVMYDYLDGRSEQPSPDPLSDGECLFEVFIDSIDPHARRERDHQAGGERSDDGYLQELSQAAKRAIGQLPARGAIADMARRSAQRSAQAQIRMHAAPLLGTAQLEQWARREAHGTVLEWRELLAGAASSVIALYALIAAAGAERTTAAEAAQLDAVYLSISALSTILDSLIDHEDDAIAGAGAFIAHYETPELLGDALVCVARQAAAQARSLPGGANHLMMLAGVVAYFTSSPGARSELARPIVERLHAELRPLITPTLAVMRAWRLAKALSARRSGVLAAETPAATPRTPGG
jgi:tetraprenyl-beta-curcumene synthase